MVSDAQGRVTGVASASVGLRTLMTLVTLRQINLPINLFGTQGIGARMRALRRLPRLERVVPSIRFESTDGRWVIAAAVLGSGIAFLDGSVVNTALPSIRKTFDANLAGQQWVVTGYLLTLGSLLVVGGSLGDLFGRRRMFVWGLIGFSITSLLCGLAQSLPMLVIARVLQGVSAALLVPGSLAMLSSVFHPDDRARAIGSWSGLSTISTALGPFLGGWLIDAVSWRLVFLINLPLAAAAIYIAHRFVPETRGDTNRSIDIPGIVALSVGLGAVVYSLIEGPANGWPVTAIVATAVGVSALIVFVLIESRSNHPMVPLSLFRSRRFAGTNAATFVIWGAIGAVFFLLTLHLQNDLGYSALEAGASTLPITVLLLLFSAKSGAVAQRIGPRLPMTLGPVVVALAFVSMSRIKAGDAYLSHVLPPVALLGLGLVIVVAPLTATVLAAVEDRFAGVGSAINNAVARVASLLAIAVLPALSGVAGSGGSLAKGFDTAMLICAALAAVGTLICWVTIRNN
jgi:EmrB/QacA subfamily drug resistance transporter